MHYQMPRAQRRTSGWQHNLFKAITARSRRFNIINDRSNTKLPTCAVRRAGLAPIFPTPAAWLPRAPSRPAARSHPGAPKDDLPPLTSPRRASWRLPPAPCRARPPGTQPRQSLLARGWVPAGRGTRGLGPPRASPGRQR